MSIASRVSIAVVAALWVSACAAPSSDSRTIYAPRGDWSSSDVDVTRVVDVGPDAYPSRTYFYEPADTRHVYWYEDAYPDSWYYRPYYRDFDRTYFVERDGRAVRRVYFDDRRAESFDWKRHARWDDNRRARLRENARDEWQRREREERDWRSRWEQRHRGDRR